MNAQEIVNRVWDWFMVQRKPRSVGRDTSCKYRSGKRRCAVGLLITDEKWEQALSMYGSAENVERAIPRDLVEKRLVPTRNVRLLDDLQDWHDELHLFSQRLMPKDEAKEEMEEICRRHRLKRPWRRWEVVSG